MNILYYKKKESKILFEDLLFTDKIYESKHINNEVMDVVELISYKLKMKLPKILNKEEQSTYEYSGWNVTPVTSKRLIQSIENDEDLKIVQHLKNETIDYPIYFKFSNLEKITHAQVDGRVMDYTNLQDYSLIKKDVKRKIYIEVNINNYSDIIYNVENFYVMKSYLAHEMQHAFEMYILPDRNTICSKKNFIYYDFTNNDEFGLANSDIYNRIQKLFYCMSYEEQRARTQGLYKFLKLVSNTRYLRKKMFTESYKNDINEQKKQHRYNYETVDNLIKNINKNSYVSAITLSNHFYNNICDVRLMRQYSKFTAMRIMYHIEMLIIGFYMYRHNMLDFNLGTVKMKDSNVRKFFSKENINHFINEEYNKMFQYDNIKFYAEFVYDNIIENFNNYIDTIFDTMNDMKDKLFEYKEWYEDVEIFENNDFKTIKEKHIKVLYE